MFGLVMPEKIAEEVVAKYVKLTFDPATKELIKVVMPFASKSEVMTLTIDKGWVTEATVEDVETPTRCAPDDVPSARRRMGGARNRAGCPIWAREVRD